MKTKGVLASSSLAGAILAGGSVAKANPSALISGRMESFLPLAQSVSDTVMTIFMLGGTLAVLVGVRAKSGAKRP